MRRADQALVAALLAIGLAAMAFYCFQHACQGRRLIEIDRQPRRHVQFAVDVNQADWPELAQIPEIGETLARRIVESRRQQGPFADLDDLRRVRGIGPRTLERMRPYLLPVPNRRSIAGP